MVTLRWQSHEIEIRVDPTYSPGSVDNLRTYNREVSLGAPGEQLGSRYGVTVATDGQEIASCIVLGAGGSTTVHERTAVVSGGRLFLAIGNHVCAFKLPSLEHEWDLETDAATCFGVVAVAGQDALISHGELEIMRLSLDGAVVWRQAGRDIFTGELTIDTTGVQVTDWNGDRYRYNVATGEPSQDEA